MARVTQQEALDIAQRFIDGHFGNVGREGPRISIPANHERDDDIRLIDYIATSTPRANADAVSIALARVLDDHTDRVLELVAVDCESQAAAWERYGGPDGLHTGDGAGRAKKARVLRAQAKRIRAMKQGA
jgi:hypothetical protein